jgi:hypothetical protein
MQNYTKDIKMKSLDNTNGMDISTCFNGINIINDDINFQAILKLEIKPYDNQGIFNINILLQILKDLKEIQNNINKNTLDKLKEIQKNTLDVLNECLDKLIEENIKSMDSNPSYKKYCESNAIVKYPEIIITSEINLI